ncbi:biotin-dependent carboxylase-like uncharacterized protein [Friedmanniella endophytica]|uniref:Biotin-dependent carboxylase-like uncharacterized protein n=1 Tax=Microlunatus kandeliicorticis TaxID=1759536 RepID=A0A7W3P4W0_9ACTN|nr:biotin-dependent carboxyltransferase family protein [Microlunatus kandeliicorticis]MBA8793319.1 biotin-dependent carboxylase-like uncharacterized protein [Microlunatus kandeliicorticis]
MITVVRPGPLALLQDLGRPGLAAIGVPTSGAADRGQAALAHRLVGNRPDAALLETVLGGLELRSDDPLWCAVTGPATAVTVDGRPVGTHRRVLLPPDVPLVVAAPPRGLRHYVAVRGGLVPPPVLGSRSTDLLSGLGPAPLRAGDRLPVGDPTGPLPPAVRLPPPAAVGELWLTTGPRRDWLDGTGWSALVGTTWEVSAESNRVGVRLTGPPVPRRTDAELPSEGLVRGAVQLPPSGQPVLFGADHPVTGGYPVVAVLTPTSADAAAQLRPGDRVRLRFRPGPAGGAHPVEPGAPATAR